MPSAITHIATTDGSRLIKRLLTHWGHKFEVVLQEQHGEVPFDADTRAVLDASPDQLIVTVIAASAERLQQMQGVVADHLHRMARGETLQIDWQPGTGA